ncbi:hypothetical protein [Poinsettia branch-inducing phytoplasma]|uniref:hypothetical protein n=1 Tax=Poinsettia branch-inducing phytoplasma TaxID=138647 RepID=UPI0004B04275|nr:hypothetical protein [Poinsettia branch-inducing phytoplasma]
MLFAGGFLIAVLLFQWGSSLPKTHLHLPLKESIKEETVLLQETQPSSFKPLSSEIDNFYYHSLLLLKEQTYQNTECYNVYLGENTGIKEALGWLKYHFPAKTFEKDFSYALYNASDSTSEPVHFKYRIKEPPPEHFLLAYFAGGTREGKNDTYTLEDLKQRRNGATNLYLFWNKNAPSTPLPDTFLFQPQNYHLEIMYDKGTNFGGPSYFFIDKIVVKEIAKDKIVAIYPINQKIEEPFTIFNYDFELKFPFYNYTQEGMLWNTNHIKSLKKIDLYEKKTGQHRTLYYDVN